jgi:small subunit ribosomal protein S3
MGQKCNPVGLRLGIIKGWDSNWYGGRNYADKLMEDEKIRGYITARIPGGGISKVLIERTLKRLIITIMTARPGIVIGKGGQEVEKLKEELKSLTDKEVQINIYEIKRPEIDAKLVGENIAAQLRARVSFRRALKMAVAAGMRMGALGIKVQASGCLGGAEMSRTERYMEGRIPLQTLRADIDYALSTANTISGTIGIKVWVFHGEKYGKIDLSPEALYGKGARNADRGPGAERGGDRGERGDRGDRRGGGDRRDRNDRGGDRGQGGGGGGGRRPRTGGGR